MKLIHWLLLATPLKQIIFLAVIPPWHGPDEQAHFAQVQYLAEFARLLKPVSETWNNSRLTTEYHYFHLTPNKGCGGQVVLNSLSKKDFLGIFLFPFLSCSKRSSPFLPRTLLTIS